jgi:virginiamycin B lyase
MTNGPDGALWFLTYNSNVIGRTTTAGTTSFFPAPTGAEGAWGNDGITTGPDGALWFLAEGGSQIGRMTTSGSVTTFPLPFGSASAITQGPDGALWFTINNTEGNNAIGRISTSGQITTYTDPSLYSANWDIRPRFTHRFMWDITTGPDGNLWFPMEYASNFQHPSFIGKITTSGVITSYSIPFPAEPTRLTAGPDGAIWFGNFGDVPAIGRVTTSGQFSEYSDPGHIGQVLGITTGPDGALWFTNSPPLQLAQDSPTYAPVMKLTTDGTFTQYTDPGMSGTLSITSGPDGALWFVDHTNDTVGRISTP